MNELTQKEIKLALDTLNDIAPDTVDEGEFGPWKFTNLTKNGDEYSLSFTNVDGPSCFVFNFKNPLIIDNQVNEKWTQKIMDLSIEWEDQF